MSNSNITINQFFSLKGNELTKTQLSAIESNKNISQIKEQIAEKLANVKWPLAFNKIIEGIEELLGVDIVDIMVGAWNKSKILSKYLNKKKYPPNETILIPLVEHTIKSKHHPYIEILLNDNSVGRINFEINLDIILKGIILKVQSGKIKEIMTGSCKGKGNIKCEDYVIVEKELMSITLPLAINLADGVAIVN